MKRISCVGLLVLMTFVMTGCLATQPKTQQTQLQIREFQTRTYETTNTKMIMKAVMSTLQDDGFIIKQANLELGLLSATKEVNAKNNGEAFLAVLFAGAAARYNNNAVVEASANISEFGEQTRIRVNFQKKVMDNYGAVRSVESVGDGTFYQNFYAKVDKGVFIEKEKI